MIKISILTLFPDMFTGPFSQSILKRAQEKGLVEIKIFNLRNWAKDKHKTVDDRPYGGGVGMIIKVEPIFEALQSLTARVKAKKTKTILLSPAGKVFNQTKARELSRVNHLIIICGHYEGVDERIRQHLVDEEISLGDFILTGGEIPAMAMVDSLIRLIPGVLEKKEAIQNESFSKLRIKKSTIENLLEYPQYTRPAEFKGWQVPKILISGDHQKIKDWQKKQSWLRTKKSRPDLLKV